MAHPSNMGEGCQPTDRGWAERNGSGPRRAEWANSYFQDLFEPIGLLGYYAPLFEGAQETFTCVLLHLSAQSGIRKQQSKLLGQRPWLTGLDQETVKAIPNDLGNASDAGRHNRNAHGE